MTEGDSVANAGAEERALSVHPEDDCSHVRVCKPGTGLGQHAKRPWRVSPPFSASRH